MWHQEALERARSASLCRRGADAPGAASIPALFKCHMPGFTSFDWLVEADPQGAWRQSHIEAPFLHLHLKPQCLAEGQYGMKSLIEEEIHIQM